MTFLPVCYKIYFANLYETFGQQQNDVFATRSLSARNHFTCYIQINRAIAVGAISILAAVAAEFQ